MKKLILTLSFLLVFSGSAFAVGGKQTVKATVSTFKPRLKVCFKPSDVFSRSHCVEVKNGESDSTSYQYNSHKTYYWTIETDRNNIAFISKSCRLLGFEQAGEYVGNGIIVDVPGSYIAKRPTAHANYQFSFYLKQKMENGKQMKFVYCREHASD